MRPGLLLGALLLLLAVLGLLVAQRVLAPAAPPPARQVATVQRATVTASVNASGSVVAVRQAKLSFRTGGVIAGIDVGVGDHVQAGQTLATLVPDALQLKLDQARSSLRAAQLKLEQLERGARPEEITAARAAVDAAAAQYGDLVAGATASDIAVAEATVESARAALRAAQLKYEDTKAGPTSAEVTAARATVDTAQANLVAAEARLHTLREGPTAAELIAAENAVVSARAALTSAQRKLDEARAGPVAADLATAASAVEVAEATLAGAQAKLADLRQQPRPSDLAAAERDVVGARSTLASAEATWHARRNILAGYSDASQPIPYEAEDNVRAAEAAVAAARQALQAAEAKLIQVKAGPTEAELVGAQTAIDQAEANLRAARARYAQLKAGSTAAELAAAESTAELARATLQNAVAKLDELRAGPTSDEVAAAQSSVDVAKASLTSAQAKLEELEAGPKESDVRIAETNVESAQAALASAWAKLVATTAAPRPGELGGALSSVESARRQLAALTPTELDLALTREAVVAAEMTVRQGELDLSNAAIVAPFDGIVSAVSGQVGEQASGQAASSIGSVVLLVDPREVRMDVSVYEIDVAKVQPGTLATVTFDAFRDRTYPATVTAIAPSGVANQGVVTFQVSLSVDPARFSSSNTTDASTGAAAPGTSGGPNAAVGAQPQVLPVGLTASVVIAIAQKEGVLAVSRRAIKTEGADKTVEVLLPDGTTETRVIKTGLVGDQLTEITDGLAEGEQVVVPTTTTRAPSVGGAPGLFGSPLPGPPPGRPPM
ncbi:MAG: HlyD family efflux transporter periplasmic adaptor subunit [Chloroflexi bacterium]|nr:HlyD family efflux transporter periplasmic adaptor subunit [Chloroflexota bacterium]